MRNQQHALPPFFKQFVDKFHKTLLHCAGRFPAGVADIVAFGVFDVVESLIDIGKDRFQIVFFQPFSLAEIHLAQPFGIVHRQIKYAADNVGAFSGAFQIACINRFNLFPAELPCCSPSLLCAGFVKRRVIPALYFFFCVPVRLPVSHQV